MPRYVLGVHSGHDASACLIRDNEIVYAIEKERLTRKKHDFGEPLECIEYVLSAEGITYADIDFVVRVNWYDSTELIDAYYNRFKKVIVRYEHHLFHAYAVSLMNQEEDMLAYIVDGRGCRPIDNGEKGEADVFEAESLYQIHRNHIKSVLEEKRYAKHYSNRYCWGSHMDSLGYAYADLSRLIFQDYNAAGKIMALAAFGKENTKIPTALIYNNNKFAVSSDWLEYLSGFKYPLSYHSEIAKDLAYRLQKEVEEYICFRIETITRKYNCFNVGLSGGVALNCKCNGVLINKGIIDNMHLFPACGDNGIAVGAAVWAIREVFCDYNTISWQYDMGKTYESINQNDVVIDYVADLLSEGKIIGLYENGAEFGPRALCNRSIIASAKDANMRYILNKHIKDRELFRPFGGVVAERNLSQLTEEKIASRYMLSAIHVKEDFIAQIPSLVHEDKTLRVQIIDENDRNRTITKILNKMEEKYGEIVLINTSFNGKGEPIVETIDQARSTARKIGLDYLLINGRGEKVREC